MQKRYGWDEREACHKASACNRRNLWHDRDDSGIDRQRICLRKEWYGVFPYKKFDEYGKLSHKNLDDLQSGGRSLLVSGEDEKEDPLDFVLWKPKKEGEPAWESLGATDVLDGILSVL